MAGGSRTSSRARRTTVAAALLLSVVIAGARASAADTVECRIVYETSDGVYVDAGSERGVRPGDTGLVLRGGAGTTRLQVVQTAARTAFCRWITGQGAERLRGDDRVAITLTALTLALAAPATPAPAVPAPAAPAAPAPAVPAPAAPAPAALRETEVGTDAATASAVATGTAPATSTTTATGTSTATPTATSSTPGTTPGTTPSTTPGTHPAPARATALSGRVEESENGFIPLLGPRGPEVGFPERSNIFHGRLRLREVFQLDPKSHLDYSRTRLGSDGSLERIDGTPWTLDWSGDLSYRDGRAFSRSRDYREPRLDVYRLSLRRKFDDGGFLRLGRFLPPELPGAGYIDGVQKEQVLSRNFRFGLLAGLKPTRFELDISAKEPTGVVYGTAEAGKPQDLYYSGTLGVLGSAYEGKFDRFALLLDQRADITSRVSVFSAAELDTGAGAGVREVRDGASLSHIDAYALATVTSFLTLRAGLDHYERPPTRVEVDLLPSIAGEEDRFFDRGYWRYFVGGTESLPWRLRLDEEIAFIDAPGEDYTPRWRVSLTRRGLPLFEDGSVTMTAYNLDGAVTQTEYLEQNPIRS